MPRPAHTAEQRAAARGRVIACARRAYVEAGLEGVTMRGVAERAGCSTAALYRHFAGRVALLRAMWADATEALNAEAARAEARVPDPVERIRTVLAAYAGLAERDPDAFLSTFLQIWTPTPERLVFDDPEGQAAYRVLRRAVRDATRTGLFLPIDPDLGAQSLWAAVHGALALPVNLGDFPFADRAERLRATVDMAVRGLSATPGTARRP